MLLCGDESGATEQNEPMSVTEAGDQEWEKSECNLDQTTGIL